MKSSAFFVMLAGLAFAPPCFAQPAATQGGAQVENVIVTAPRWLGEKPQMVIHNFVNAYAMAATSTVGEIARWKFGICTRTYGLSKPEYDKFVTDRIEAIAAEAGVELVPAPCRLNVEIVFTDKPQDFLDKVHQMGARLLGPRPSQADSVAKMRYPIQAWYATATRDLFGMLILDDEDNAQFGPAQISEYRAPPIFNAPTKQVEGWRWRTGLNSELAHIYVVADTSKTQGYELGAVADYIAMLALSQTQSFDSCKPMPSISNLISPGCDAELKPKAITDTDMAFLRGVYTMDPGANLQQQQNHIANQIAVSLGVK